MIPRPEDFEIIDARTRPFLKNEGCIGQFGKPENVEEFDGMPVRRL